MSKALLFGVSGQDGYYLQRKLSALGIEVTGVSRSEGDWIKGDVADFAFVESIIKSTLPDFIFHFAANSTVQHDALFENHATICNGTLNVLESVKKHSPLSRVFISGSGLQFVNTGNPISERDPFEARDPYSIARVHSVYAARYFRTLGIKVYIGYFFNHDSPLRSERHINQKICKTVNRIAAGEKVKLELGDISVKKEFTFAGDTVNAVWKLVNNEHVFETVIGSGKAYSIQDWLEICFRFRNLNWKEHVTFIAGFKPDYPVLVSDPSTLFQLGWKQTVGINELARIMMMNDESA